MSQIIIGVDEVGRGAVAGPMYLGGVVVIPSHPLFSLLSQRFEFLNLLLEEKEKIILRDSKKMTPRQRQRAARFLESQLNFFLVKISNQLIDEKGISQAFKLGLNQLLERVSSVFSLTETKLLLDGNLLPSLDVPLVAAEAVVKGDNKIGVIAAAAVVAKVHRDEFMTNLSPTYPEYHWEKNVGYGTREHFEAIRRLGVTPYHRRSFLTRVLSS